MREVVLNRFDGLTDTIKCYTVEEFDYINMPHFARKVRCKGKNKPQYYLHDIATFDIETTTIKAEVPYGFMYHWQMCIMGVVVYGRRWEEFIYLINKITKWHDLSAEGTRLVVYIHNAGYEFEFMRNILEEHFGGYTIFAAQARKPIYISCNNGIEFRCSYKLTNMSLQKAVENELGTIHPKAAGDLDYKITRTADTVLTDTEFGYCIADVVSLYEMIKSRMKNENDNIETIPLTSTGYVRRDTRNATRKEPHYRDNYFIKCRMNPKVYELLTEAGRGGNTHANRYMSGRVYVNVDSNDVASSYPFQMLCKTFPVTAFTYYGPIDSMNEFDNLLNTRACLFRIRFYNIKVKKDVTMPYIPTAKVFEKIGDFKYDNGRILKNDGCFTMTITDIDYKIIKKQYTWDSIAVTEMHTAQYGMLPESIRQTILKYFIDKSTLKYKIENCEDEEQKANYQYLYAKSKNRLNGIFGMTYTNPIHPVMEVDRLTGQWSANFPDVAEELGKFYKSRNNFLAYQWGVWTTCRAREHLERLLDLTGTNTIYCDTDSSKYISSPEIEKAIALENESIKRLAEEKGAYCDVNGVRYHLGVYEKETEKPYKTFKTLGAKKYCYEDDKGLHITISGVSKSGAKEMQKIDNFVPGFIFRENAGSTLYYNDVEHTYYIEVDGCRMLTGSNIGMVDSTYEIGVTDEYAELIGFNILRELN